MDKKTWLIGGLIVAAFLLVGGFWVWQRNQETPVEANFEREPIVETASALDMKGYDFTKIIPGSADSGNMEEHVIGDKDAEVLIFEYADYQCEHCAAMNPYVNKLVEDYKGKVAVVYRNYILPYHSNAVAASAAANAAAKQGFWKSYKDLLFSNQNDWYFSTNKKAIEQFEQYFEQVAGEKGNLEQFKADMRSAEVAQKTAFDLAVGEAVNIAGTPSFYLDGKHIDQSGMKYSEFLDKMHELIDPKLKK